MRGGLREGGLSNYNIIDRFAERGGGRQREQRAGGGPPSIGSSCRSGAVKSNPRWKEKHNRFIVQTGMRKRVEPVHTGG